MDVTPAEDEPNGGDAENTVPAEQDDAPAPDEEFDAAWNDEPNTIPEVVTPPPDMDEARAIGDTGLGGEAIK